MKNQKYNTKKFKLDIQQSHLFFKAYTRQAAYKVTQI